jgi:alkyl sulfatase BDS1-like metallo-beta-lactamase superfamily hydrolase
MSDERDERKGASRATIERNTELAKGLLWDNHESFEDARHGFIETTEPLVIKEDGQVVWDMAVFLSPLGHQTPASHPADTVNPSLWRQAKLNSFNGLFEVHQRIYQVRAFDVSNMTIIEGETGLIVIDPLASVECARAALKLYHEHRQRRGEAGTPEVKAVIYTHSHVDHFGGVEGVLPTDPDKRKEVAIYAPDGFLEHAVSENIYASAAMGRRSQYSYGEILHRDDKGLVDSGIGKTISLGTVSLDPPTVTITQQVQREKVAGLEVIFHLTPSSEAPAEMDFYFPKLKAYCPAENATRNMHNLQTLRGANVRDALKWSKYLSESLEMFGGEVEVMFASHHWPVFGHERVVHHLARQRDMYRYLNDQTLRMLNKGYTGTEIAEVFEMPTTLAEDWSCRGYYGTTSHNSKAVYDKYMGWYDGDPVNLHRLPPRETALRYVQLVGAERLIEVAGEATAKGEYRWAAELLHHVVYACPERTDVRGLLADVYEQMGYAAESGTWRNIYLAGAKELRHGPTEMALPTAGISMTASMTTEMIFDAFGLRLIGPQAGIKPISMNWELGKLGEGPNRCLVRVENAALSYVQGKHDANADVTVRMTRDTMNRLLAGDLSLGEAIRDGLIETRGDRRALLRFFCLMDTQDQHFPIVTPRKDARRAWEGSDTLDGLAGIADGTATEEAMLSHPGVKKARPFVLEFLHGC